MDLTHSIIWMFIGSIIIGIFFNGMNFLAYSFNDLYFDAKTLIYVALLMASNMCILEVLMFYNAHGELNIYYLLSFLFFSAFCIFLLRQQAFIGDNDWLKRMISHHSTAITTSKKINERTQNPLIKKLSKDIIVTQEKEIAYMKYLLQN